MSLPNLPYQNFVTFYLHEQELAWMVWATMIKTELAKSAGCLLAQRCWWVWN